jgi:hypothetical protein
MAQYTLSIFEQLISALPPMFPLDTAQKMSFAIDQLKNDSRTNQKMVEDTMIRFGYDLWPWRQAFNDFFGLNEGKLGEQFFLSHLPAELGEHYMKYKEYGLTWRDLYSGRAVKYFDDDGRVVLYEALVKTKNDLVSFTAREVSGLLKKQYLSKVEEYKQTLAKVQSILNQMRAMADEEQYHPVLADELRARVRSFECGLCALGPSFEINDVMQALEFFVERKIHLNMMRGIDKSTAIDFYN